VNKEGATINSKTPKLLCLNFGWCELLGALPAGRFTSTIRCATHDLGAKRCEREVVDVEYSGNPAEETFYDGVLLGQ
jgi:hypothetical protein